MHIAIYNDCDSRGGVLTYTLTLSVELVRQGVDVTIVTHEPNSDFSRYIVRDMESSASRVKYLPVNNDTLDNAKMFAQLLLKISPDIFIPNYRQISHVAAAMISRISDIKNLGICHNNHKSSYDQKIHYQSIYSKIVCASNITANYLQNLLPARTEDIIYIPHGVRIVDIPCEKFTGGKIKLIYFGRLIEEQKRISELLKIADRLHKDSVPFKLTLIGDGINIDQYNNFIKQNILDEHVEIIESRPWNELAAFLQNSHIVVSTSEYEGFCLSLAEGMGASLPAVAYNCGEILGQFLINSETGFLIDKNSRQDFVDKIKIIQNDPILWERLSNSARKKISAEFSWSVIIRKYLNLFDIIVNENRKLRWPTGRPIWVPPGGRTIESIIERLGKTIKIW